MPNLRLKCYPHFRTNHIQSSILWLTKIYIFCEFLVSFQGFFGFLFSDGNIYDENIYIYIWIWLHEGRKLDKPQSHKKFNKFSLLFFWVFNCYGFILKLFFKLLKQHIGNKYVYDIPKLKLHYLGLILLLLRN